MDSAMAFKLTEDFPIAALNGPTRPKAQAAQPFVV